MPTAAPPPERGKVWPHRGLVSSVVPSAERSGLPEPKPFRYREAETQREAAVAYDLASLRLTRCPGPSCQRYARSACSGICGWGEDTTVPLPRLA